MITYAILGGNEEAVGEVKGALQNYPDYLLLGDAISNNEAYEVILKNPPNLVFVDFDSYSSADIPLNFIAELHQYLPELPSFIGVSGKKGFAYEALKNGFVDYLLKPLAPVEVVKTLVKYRRNNNKSETRKICLKSYSDYHFLDLSEVIYMQADNNNTDFHLSSIYKVPGFKTLKYYEELLPENFVRIHNSYVINTEKVTRINFGKNKVYLHSNIKLPFSKSYKKNVEMVKSKLTADNIISPD
ncbi:LytTR family DNA-binding domain-containing protein [Zunongwangia sp. F363]|uniref:LytTR family DNA-binding domain-containing protein n=1 Tax=Autumnicola tepida TaxID=3075595 RepID=A0ABU3C7A4_9FLAO|nr:LytTR family DNA-binding domain-containing protein [Zunongwangia sp. F363]MDT0642214.1 LytTR family DNA-binding domain-containing protein [Zunongwangia sp. F363]